MNEQELLEKGYRKYLGNEIDVYFNLTMCQHSGFCTKGLHHVFDLKKKPWIDVNAEEVEELKKQIDQCPSGALQYIIKR